jgi:hypothetical protein
MKVTPLHVTPTSIPAVAGGCEVEATLSASCMVIMSEKKKEFPCLVKNNGHASQNFIWLSI